MWTPTPFYPDLSRFKEVSIDTETNDPNLDKLGPGAMRRDGFLVGVSIATSEFKVYYPIRHEAGGNLPKSTVIEYLKRELANKDLTIIGSNLMYDLQWLWSEGIRVAGYKKDVMLRDALIDENQRDYDLDSIALRYALEGKDQTLLRQEAAKHGWTKEKQIKQNLWKLHSAFVGPYGEMDAALPLLIYNLQKEFISKLELDRVDHLESRLTDVLFKMWERGMPVDLNKAEQGMSKLSNLYKEAIAKLKYEVGFEVDVWSGQSLQRAYEAKGVEYVKTPKGNPSFTAEWLDEQTDDLSLSVLRARQFDRSGSVFIESKIVNASINGRIHPNYKQTKTEDGGGTKSGRLSSSNPNLQQVPARNVELSKIIRSLFLSDTGKFGVFDYSQQEPRVYIHFASLRGFAGAIEAVRKYSDDPKTDYHTFVANMCESVTGVKVPRKDAKTINLGLSYGMGGAKLCRSLGLPTEWVEIRGVMVEVAGAQGQELLKTYDQAVPFVKLLAKDAANLAKRRGYVKTILGRRCNFPDAKFTHKAGNRIIQGSSADMVKQAIVNLAEAGYLPYNTVHDEVDNPIEDIQKDCREIRDIMLNAIELSVPLLVDIEVGPSWGECQEIQL